jgi:N-acetylglutamate synthase-like GNAT family acetyltransferase
VSFRFSDRVEDVDRDLVHDWIAATYWGAGRTREVMDAAIDGSRVYSVLDEETGAQVAFARIVTDGATFAWLADVVVDPSVRGRGVGVQLIEGIVSSLAPLGLRRILLATKDAHGLYEKFGFEVLTEPERWMALQDPDAPSLRP